MRRVPFTGDEKESLYVALDRHRDAILWKIDGLSDDDLRRPIVPSGTTLLGMVKHLASVDYAWFCSTFGRESLEVPADEDDWDADWRIEPWETTEGVLAYFAMARKAADEVIHDLDLTDTGTAWYGPTVSLRWVLIHMVEEYARHAGHADILRELVDGATGPFEGYPT
ncbi:MULTISPECIES: DinB family protein [Mumia]|uniref:DinB family protein n=1 Tax=Mumia TaxID=1546255 RepID=UPI001422EECE|nr:MULTISPECIES: DinB family protein [unclassified Mumia]QMW65491.1 DinB family protein [Mumia sp. ZJ1417]